MSWYQPILDVLLVLLKLFWSPFANPELLWIIIPIYLNWLAAEIWQEKKGTSFGNAISNGFVLLWVGVDWARTTIRLIENHTSWLLVASKTFIFFLILTYGFLIVYNGIKVKKVTHYIGRIREVSYACLVFTPIFYDVVPLDWKSIIAVLVGFPAFYYLVELVDKITPDPEVYKEDEAPQSGAEVPKSESETASLPDFNKPFDQTNSSTMPQQAPPEQPPAMPPESPSMTQQYPAQPPLQSGYRPRLRRRF